MSIHLLYGQLCIENGEFNRANQLLHCY